MDIGSVLGSAAGRIKFRTKLFSSYILLLSITIVLGGVIFYRGSRSVVLDLASKNVYQTIRSKNEVLDAKFSKTLESSLTILSDAELFKIFEDMASGDDNMLSFDRKITRIINNYFPVMENVSGVQIATSHYIFGNNSSMLTTEAYLESRLYREARKTGGRLVWTPTYDPAGALGESEGKARGTPLFSAARLMNSFYLDNSRLSFLKKGVERPVLIVNFEEAFIAAVFAGSVPVPGAVFSVIDAEGNVISHSDRNEVGKRIRPSWLPYAIETGTGITDTEDGPDRIICFDTSGVTGWIAVAEVPVNELTRRIVFSILIFTIAAAVGLTTLALSLSFSLTRLINDPMDKLLEAIRSTGSGNFDAKIPVQEGDEFGFLLKKFNDMNDQVKVLIEENYTVKLREKETEIMALNLQFNPHFLYNTLNVINWMAIEEGKKDISDMLMSLCDMLVYTVRNKEDIVLFEDDLQWLRRYLFIMSVRFEDKFSVRWDIDPSLNRTRVPKLFLQPLVENAILHGLEGVERGGLIEISGMVGKETRIFRVRDNGKGMATAALPRDAGDRQDSVGLFNIDRRIKLLFGRDYGVTLASRPGEGTQAEITLPYEGP